MSFTTAWAVVTCQELQNNNYNKLPKSQIFCPQFFYQAIRVWLLLVQCLNVSSPPTLNIFFIKSTTLCLFKSLLIRIVTLVSACTCNRKCIFHYYSGIGCVCEPSLQSVIFFNCMLQATFWIKYGHVPFKCVQFIFLFRTQLHP